MYNLNRRDFKKYTKRKSGYNSIDIKMEDLSELGKMLAEKVANPDVFDTERELSILLYENVRKEIDIEIVKNLHYWKFFIIFVNGK